MENEKCLKQLAKYVDESKILKLIDRMYNGESLSTSQFDTIFDYIKKKGHKSVMEEEVFTPVRNESQIIRYEKSTYDRKGVRYLGVFVTTEYGDKIIYFGDTRKRKISSIKRYPDCLIRN